MLVYDLLLARSEDPDGDRAAFDKAYRAYVDSFDVFGGYMHALETRAKAFAPLRSIAEHERQAAAEQKASAEAADRRLALTVRRLADVEAAAPEGMDADRTLRRLEAKHEALKAAHRENLKVYAAQGAAFAAELAAVKEEAAVQLTNEIRDGRLAYEELRREAGEAKDRLAAAEPDVEKAAALESEMEEARAAYEELRLEAARTRERLSELERVHAVVLHEFHIARRDLDVIHRSRSWRMTAPLRSASQTPRTALSRSLTEAPAEAFQRRVMARARRIGCFDVDDYIALHSDLAAIEPYEHFANFGVWEGRRGVAPERLLGRLARTAAEVAIDAAGKASWEQGYRRSLDSRPTIVLPDLPDRRDLATTRALQAALQHVGVPVPGGAGRLARSRCDARHRATRPDPIPERAS